MISDVIVFIFRKPKKKRKSVATTIVDNPYNRGGELIGDHDKKVFYNELKLYFEYIFRQ